jgi:hypothetical protein
VADNIYVIHKNGGGMPSMDEAAAQLHVPVEKLDREFGVQPIEPKSGDYAVRLKENAPHEGAPSGSGPFSDPRIDTVGPPR